MFGHLKTLLLSLRDDAVRELGRQLAEVELQLREAQQREAKLAMRCRVTAAQRDAAERVLHAVLKGIDFQPLDASWQEPPTAAEQAVGAHIRAKLATVYEMLDAAEIRSSRAAKDCEDFRAALADERHEHDKTQKRLDASDVQNKQLCEIIERDRARVAAETAIHIRRKAQAETDARRQPEDDDR